MKSIINLIKTMWDRFSNGNTMSPTGAMPISV